MKTTTAVKPPEEEIPTARQEYYKEILASVHEELDKLDNDSEISIDTLLERASIAEESYMEAIKWFKTKNGQPAVILKREVSEIFINNYNSVLMQAWEANLDVQLVTSVLTCVFYVASYVSKPEKTLGDLLKAVSKSGQHLGAKASMRSVAKKFLSHREVCAQEAVYRLLSLPLTQGSRQVLFIPTDLPENRTRLFKPMKDLQRLDDDDPNVFQTNILDRYSARPNKLEDTCLAAFAANYCYKRSARKDDNNQGDSFGEDSDSIDGIVDNSLPKEIVLKKDLGHMVRRKTQAIIRSHQFSVIKDPEQYYHSQLLLYLPWRNEATDLLQPTFESCHRDNSDIIRENKARFEYHAEDVAEAMENLEEFGAPEENWGDIAAQNEQARVEERQEGAQQDEQSLYNALDVTEDQQVRGDLGLIPHSFELLTEKMTSQEYNDLVLSLNDKQSDVHSHILDWCTKMILTHQIEKPPPFHIFLTGGAGVGKSHLVRAIVQTATRIFTRNNQIDSRHVLVCGPTGTAAYNVAGYTLHSALLIPIEQTKFDDYVPLSNEKLASLKESLGDVKIMIIDEISMVGSDMLLTIHRRLCDIMGNEEPFGGVSILAVGDLLQLPPVGQFPIYNSPSDELAAIYGSLWTTHFKIVELTEIVRQQGDEKFSSLLNRIRIGQHTTADIDMLKGRQIEKDNDSYPAKSTHVYAYNDNVDMHNKKMLETLSTPKYTFVATDSTRDSQTGRVEVATFGKEKCGLAKEVTLAVGARMILTKNIDVSDGLVNCAAGEVKGFLPPPPDNEQELHNYIPKYVLVKFDEERVGRNCRRAFRGTLPNPEWTPIPRVEIHKRLGRYSKITAKRIQFPIKLAWALTIHKEQGKTEDELVLSCDGTFRSGQFYTGISRTKTLHGLFILGKMDPRKIKVNVKSYAEIKRMKKESVLTVATPISVKASSDYSFRVLFLNVNSLLPHARSIEMDKNITSGDIICLAETWLKPGDGCPDLQDMQVLRHDNIAHGQHRGGGLLMYISLDYHIMKQFSLPNLNIEHLIALLSPRQAPQLRLCVALIYKNPRLTDRDFLRELEYMMSELPVRAVPTIITGDLNIDMLSKQASAAKLKKLMLYYGFAQLVTTPTHRKGGLLDHYYVNFISEDIQLDVIPAYYSDHLMVSAAVPYYCLQ